MAGELVPLVLLPRYSTFSGATVFTTIGIDVSDYESAIVNVWRGNFIGTGPPTFGITLEESTDRDEWAACSGATADYDPGGATEGQLTAALKRRWLRAKVTITGTDPSVSCWAVGFLELRQS